MNKVLKVFLSTIALSLCVGSAFFATINKKAATPVEAAASIDTVAINRKYFTARDDDYANNTMFDVGGGTAQETSSNAVISVSSDGTYTENANNYPAYKFVWQENGIHQKMLYYSSVVRIAVNVPAYERVRVRVLFNPIKSVMQAGGNADHAIELAADDRIHTSSNYDYSFSQFKYQRDDYTTKSPGNDVLARAGRRAEGEAATALEHSWYIVNQNEVSVNYWIFFAVSGYVESTGQTAHSTTQSVRFGINLREDVEYVCSVFANNTTYYDNVKSAVQYVNSLGSSATIRMLRDYAEPAANNGIAITNSFTLDLNGHNLSLVGSGADTFFLARQSDGLSKNITISIGNSGQSQKFVSAAVADSVFLLGDDGDQYTVTLSIGQNVLIENTYSSGRAIAVHQSATLEVNQNSTVRSSSSVCAVYINGGIARVTGSVSASNGSTFQVKKEERNSSSTIVTPKLYIYYNPTLTHSNSKYTIDVTTGGPNNLNLYASYSSSYLGTTGSDILIKYATAPTSGATIVNGVTSQSVANKFSVSGLSSSLMLQWNSNTKVLSTVTACAVSYNANGGTGTMSGKTVAQGTSINLPSCSFTAPSGKRFVQWNTNPNGTGTAKNPGDSYTVNGNVTFYAIWEYTPKGNIENNVTTRSSLAYHYSKDNGGNFTFTNLYVRFGGIVTKTMWDALDNESTIIGYGELISTANYLGANQLKSYYATANSNPNIEIRSYEVTADPESYPALYNNSDYQGVTDNYYVWNYRMSVDEANFTDVYASVAFIITEDDGVVFMNEVRKSVKNLAQDLIDGPNYDEDSLDGSLKHLADL